MTIAIVPIILKNSMNDFSDQFWLQFINNNKNYNTNNNDNNNTNNNDNNNTNDYDNNNDNNMKKTTTIIVIIPAISLTFFGERVV